MATYVISIAAIFVMLVTWILVQQIARLFALHHPEFGSHRQDGSCGSGQCGHCDSGSCANNRD